MAHDFVTRGGLVIGASAAPAREAATLADLPAKVILEDLSFTARAFAARH